MEDSFYGDTGTGQKVWDRRSEIIESNINVKINEFLEKSREFVLLFYFELRKHICCVK